jgi:hypothetical protein
MFVVLNEKYSSEHDLKEESAQFLSQHNKPREEKLISASPKIETIEEKEIPAPEKEAKDKLEPNTPIVSEETMDKVEIEKPTLKLKILNKIDIDNLIILDDNIQYESTVEEIQTTRILSKDTFCDRLRLSGPVAVFSTGMSDCESKSLLLLFILLLAAARLSNSTCRGNLSKVKMLSIIFGP